MAEPAPGKIDRVFSKALERRTRGRPGCTCTAVSQPRMGKRHHRRALFGVSGVQRPVPGFRGLACPQAWARGARQHLRPAPGAVHRRCGRLYAGGLSCLGEAQGLQPRGFPDQPDLEHAGGASGLHVRAAGQPASRACSWPMTTMRRSRSSPGPGRSGCSHRTGISRISGPRQGGCNGRRRSSSRRCATARVGPISGSGRWPISSKSRWKTCKGILDAMEGAPVQRLSEAPRMVDLQGFPQFLQSLRNQGMNPFLVGDFPQEGYVAEPRPTDQSRPYLVR
jgi:hypothetical protein